MTNKKAALFLVGGIPQTQEDLSGWTAFQSFAKEITESEAIRVVIETYEYGEGETVDATPEEVAYFYMRLVHQQSFIETHARRYGESEFFVLPDKSSV